MVTTPNPNFPTLFAEGQFGANPYFSGMTTLISTELSKRLYKTWGIQMGKQFELDAVQPGEYQGGWINTDGALDPSNTSSPLSPNVLPFRGYRMRAQYPPSINLLTNDQATGGENLAAGTTGTASGVLSAYGTYTVVATGFAFQGLQVWQFNGTTPTASQAILTVNAAGVGQSDGLSYTMSVRVRSATTGANPQVQPFINWTDPLSNGIFNITGTITTLTGNPGSGWSTLTLTGTMPTSLVSGAQFGVRLVTAPAGTWTFQVDGMQWEQNTSASTFAVPGKTYYLFSGNIERYPQAWDYTGTYGYVSPIVVDSMAMLSQQTLKAAFVEDILSLNPNFLYQLNDPVGSTSCADTAGRRPPAPIENSPYGAGSLVLGNQITSTSSGGTFVGTPGPIATFANDQTYGLTAQRPETFVSIHKTVATPGPPVGAWTRILHFRATTAPTLGNFYEFWSSLPNNIASATGVSFFQIGMDGGTFTGAGTLIVQLGATGGNTVNTNSTTVIADGNWHQVIVTVDAVGNTVVYVDGVSVGLTGTNPITVPFAGLTSDVIGCSVQLGAGYYRSGANADIALVAEIPAALTAGQVSQLYTSWKNAYLGESSGARYARILGWAGYTGPTAIDTGSTASMSSATDVPGLDALSALSSVVLTENGQHFVAGNGAVTFQARSRRYGQTVPIYTFGDALFGEITYESMYFDFDTTHISNLIQVAQTSTSQVFSAQSIASQTAYGTRSLTRNNQSSSSAECQDAALYLVSRYKDPHLRVATMRLHPSANPSVMFPVCLSLQLGMRVRVMRRPPAPAAAIQLDGFIEQIVHSMDDQGQWYTDLQISSTDTTSYWQLAALHTTVFSSVASGQNQATISALPDAAVNVLKSSLPSGYQLTFDPGTAQQETLTLAAGGIPTTVLGYTSATLTFTTNFSFNHSPGAVVCEPLPAGFTSPTTWDSASVLGAAYTTIQTSSSPGGNTVVVNPMSDSLLNGLALNWYPGDVLWLSPGTANFETAIVQSISAPYADYSSAVITFTTNLTKVHNPNEYVCEPLPAGMTNPTTLVPVPTARLAY